MKQAKNTWKRITPKVLEEWKNDFSFVERNLGIVDIKLDEHLSLKDLDFLLWACNKCESLLVLAGEEKENSKTTQLLEHVVYVDFIYLSKNLEDFSNIEYPTLYLGRNAEDVPKEVSESKGFRVETYE